MEASSLCPSHNAIKILQSAQERWAWPLIWHALRHTEWGVSLNHVHKWLRWRRNTQLRNSCTIIRRRPSSLKRPLAPSFTQVPCFVTSRLNLLQCLNQRKNGIYLNHKKWDSSVRLMTILRGARTANRISNSGRSTNSSFYTAPKKLCDSHSFISAQENCPWGTTSREGIYLLTTI